MPTFAQYESRSLAPGWLQGPRGTAYLETRGAAKDLLIAEIKEAVKARMPGIGPSDALPVLGRERMLDRGPGESEESYRARLLGAWEVWTYAGTAFGLLSAFWYAGYRPASGRVLIQAQSGLQYELRADFDPGLHPPEQAVIVTDVAPLHLGGTPAELWSDIAVLMMPPLIPSWASQFPADNSPEVESIRRLIRQWKPAHSRCVRLRATSLDLWDAPVEPYEPTEEVWDEEGVTVEWTPPAD